MNTIFSTKISHLLGLLTQEGRWQEVIEWAMRWIGFGGWPEPAYRALITAYANTGDVSKAMNIYERYAQVLQKEGGIKPSDHTQLLYKRLKAGWKTEIVKERSASGTQTSISSVDPTPTTIIPSRMRHTNLPKPLTSFIGRDNEINLVQHMISTTRLVTITGPGGVGKTRLAIEIGNKLAPIYRDGIWWIELASVIETVSTPNQSFITDVGSPQNQNQFNTNLKKPYHSGIDHVTQVISKVLRIPESPGLPVIEGVLEYLYDKELLLIMDNCEHLIEACAILAESILSNCPNVIILATSREAMKLPGEIAWSLPSLTLPSPKPSSNNQDVYQSEAVKLFIDRAAITMPGFHMEPETTNLIAQICLHLDGIPLAIELAAARTNHLSVQEIFERLDQRFNLLTAGHRTSMPRHQTLRAAIDWSFELLNDSEKILFCRLATFTGSFSLDAAEAICTSDEIDRDQIINLIGRLIDKSMVTVQINPSVIGQPSRYRLLDTMRSFGRIKLIETGESDWLFEHNAAFFARLAENAKPELLSDDSVQWQSLLQAENDNLRAVFEWCSKNDQAENALKIVGALMWFWLRTGSYREGRDLTLKALNLPSATQFPSLRARALNTAGFFLSLLGDSVSARRMLEDALSFFKSTSDLGNVGMALLLLGLVFTNESEFDLADAAFEEGLDINKKLGYSKTHPFIFFYGDQNLKQGNFERAKNRYKESVKIHRDVGNKGFLAYPLRRLGYLALEKDDIADAYNYFEESLRLNYEINDTPGFTASLVSMAVLATHLDKPVIAARLLGTADRILENSSINLLALDQVELERIRIKLLACLDPETLAALYSSGCQLSENQAFLLTKEILDIRVPTDMI
jgi:predicted ATPase